MYKNKLPTNICLSFVSEEVIFCWYILHLLNFDTADIVSFDTKYLLLFIIAKILDHNLFFIFNHNSFIWLLWESEKRRSEFMWKRQAANM